MSRRPYIQRDEFAKAVADGEQPSGQLRKQFVDVEIGKAEGQGDRVRRFCISTGSVDRDNDTIAVGGWKMDNYRKNPVVLWAHDYSALPVGKALSVNVEGDKLVSVMEFADHDMANTVMRLVDGGFLRATSVGFRPMKYALNEERRGFDFMEQELLEFSIVPVPANAEALIEARSAGVDLTAIKGWAEGVIKALEPESEKARKRQKASGLLATLVEHCHDCEKTFDGPSVIDISDGIRVRCLPCEQKRTARDVKASEPSLADVLAAVKAQADECPTCKALGAEAKQGRVLSRANESRVRQAKDMLEEVLRQLEQASEDAEERAAGCDHPAGSGMCDGCKAAEAKAGDAEVLELSEPEAKAAEFVLELSEAAEERFDIDPDVLRSVLRELVSAEIGKSVREATESAIARMRGRVD
jgi:HK97 family phage prohead protease